ncbi:unnamed protein product [Camellia sinensis]
MKVWVRESDIERGESVRMEKKYEQFKGQPRLPKFAVPKRYDINLKPDLVTCKFAGAVKITVDVVTGTKFIVLNAVDLVVDRNSLHFTDTSGCKVSEVLGVELFEEDEIMVVEFPQNLQLGLGVLCIAFEGTLMLCLVGVFEVEFGKGMRNG